MQRGKSFGGLPLFLWETFLNDLNFAVMRISLLFFILIVFGCQNNSSDKIKTSYWLSMKDSFQFKNLNNFSCDSILRMNYEKYHKIKTSLLDSIISKDDLYLYSWQERDTSKNEFTILL